IEIVRATAHAIRRRNELIGPLGPEDTISRELVTALSRGNTIPNHWSKAWADLLLGLAQAGVGKPDQADKYLQRALLIRGQYDHPLTCVALLELGKWKMVAGDVAAAVDLFAEASYSAFYYYKPHTGNLGVIDEAFRLGTMCRLASGVNGLNPALDPAAAWASRKRFDHLTARLNFAAAEESIQLGNVKAAQATLATGQSRLQDAATGLLGNWSRYLDARLQFLIGRETATAALSQAIQQHVGMSRHNLRLQLANQRYDQQQLRARSAVSIYQMLLGDPRPVDWVFRPFETLATMQTPHGLAYNRWMDAVLTRKNMATALEISDLAKRHRYHRSLAWGGRLAALRDTLETPEHLLSQKVRNQRHELLLRYPQYDEAIKRGRELQAELSRRWQPGIDAEEQSDLIKLWRQWDNNLAEREGMINQLGLQRAAVDIQYPPVMPTTTLQKKLEPGQAVVVFHETPAGMIGFLLTSKASTSWQCAPKKRLNSLVSKFLRDLGNNDANHQLPTDTLLASDWLESGSALYAGLFQGSSLDPSQLEELIVVPDGVVWYVPFAALPVQTNERLLPLISASRIRMAPTVGLAVGHTQPWRRVQRTGFVGHQVLPGEDDDDKTASLSGLREVADNPVSLPEPSPVPTPTISALTDTLVVLDDIELQLSQPLGWSPVSVSRKGKQSSLSHWLTLPQFGPQRILLPAARTVAERGGKISRRKSAGAPAGTELFLASCGLMSTGAQTILLSSWRVGGDATLELTREFLQELPYTSAADAWQRSVQLAMELPLDPDRQPRVKVKKKDDVELTAAHPFFWSGYLLIDSGAPPAADDGPEPPKAQSPPVAAK
ncbi:MAG: CHAT domain-containing protein, partial [Bythopirellula sp.]